MNNSLLSDSNEPFGTIPFNDIKVEHFIPALDISIKKGLDEINQICSNLNDPTFENTILAFECSFSDLDRITTPYFHLFGSESDDSLKSLTDEISPKVAKFQSDIYLNKKLFDRIQKVYDSKEVITDSSDLRLLEIIYKKFKRNGADLNNKQKENLRNVDKELSTLSPKFAKNSLKATNSFELWLDEEDLEGLPDLAKEAAKIAAKDKGEDDKWLITLQFPSFGPFMKFSARRDLREIVYTAMVTQCNGGDFDNTFLCKKIANLKHKRAEILGFKNYADYVLEERMAENQKNIFNLLDNLYESSISHAKNDLEQIKAVAQELDNIKNLKPWDFSYYSEKLKQKLYDFNEDSLRPYFQSENVIKGAFDIAGKLYGLQFNTLTNIQKWHSDVEIYEVRDETDSHLGLLYVDLYPRDTKRSGAWMNQLREQGYNGNEIVRPHISLTCNLTKPTADNPSLLTYNEVVTIFHEFGHCLHGLLADGKYKTLSGTNVFWDFVELPSQIMENWVGETEALSLFANHYESGELIPDELVGKIKESKNFMSGSMCLRQLSFGYLDMAWFGKNNNIDNIENFEWEATEKTSLFEKIPGASMSCKFGHIFAGGYSAGYYSYKWAEVLEADAFEKFKEDGIFNKDTAKSFRDNILSQGNNEHPMDLYKSFRGREPKVEALLKREGLLK